MREDNIDLGEGILPIHLLNLACAVHLRQEHGFRRWPISRFLETYPWLIREDGTFAELGRSWSASVVQVRG